MKKVLALILALLMTMSLVACGGSSSSNDASADSETVEDSGEKTIKETVVIGNVRDITLVDPYGSNTTEVLNMLQMTHSRLLKQNPETYEFEYDLATGYEVSEDGLEYTFTIREGVKFHNGEELTLDDIVYSFGLMAESSFTSAKVKWITNIEKLEGNKIKFTLSSPYQDMLNVFAFPNICIVNQKAIEADPVMGPGVGSGAYIIDEWSLGEQTVLVRNEEYYGEMPNTKTFVFRLITEDSSRVIALENGEIDICIQPPLAQLSYIRDNEKLELMEVVGNKLNYLALNTEKAIFDDPLVREAIACAIDRDTIIAVAAEGLGTPANSVISPKTPYYNPDQTVPQYDLERAKSLLEQAGVDPADLTFEIICNGSLRESIATIIQASLKEIGVNISVTQLDASALKSRMASQGDEAHDVVVYNWAPSPGDGTDLTFQSLFYSGSGSNRTKMADSNVDTMVDAAAVELDVAARQQLYYDLQEYLVDYAAFIPMYYETVTIGVSDNLCNFVCDVAEQHQYTYAYVEE